MICPVRVRRKSTHTFTTFVGTPSSVNTILRQTHFVRQTYNRFGRLDDARLVKETIVMCSRLLQIKIIDKLPRNL